MSESEQKRQRMHLLFELDEQKTLVASLRERTRQTSGILSELVRAGSYESGRIVVKGDEILINDKPYDLALVEPVNLANNRAEMQDAIRHLEDLLKRAKDLGITLA